MGSWLVCRRQLATVEEVAVASCEEVTLFPGLFFIYNGGGKE